MAESVTPGAIEPNDIMEPELDQPEDDVVSLEALLSDGESDQTTDEQENVVADDDQQQAEPDAPQSEQVDPKKPLTQADVDRIIAGRRDGFRRQFEREHADDLRLAQLVKDHFSGKTPEEIDEDLISVEATRLAAETGWTEEEATEKVRARHNYMRNGSPGYVDPKHLELLQKQLSDIKKADGIDFLEIVKEDQFLAEQVDSGRMDIKDAYIHYLKNGKTNQPARPSMPKKAPPPVEKSAAARGIPSNTPISDATFRKINEALKSGQKVRV